MSDKDKPKPKPKGPRPVMIPRQVQEYNRGADEVTKSRLERSGEKQTAEQKRKAVEQVKRSHDAWKRRQK